MESKYIIIILRLSNPPTQMTTLLYDGSFDGLFTAIFEVFEYRYQDVEICSKENFLQENMFAEIHEVITQQEKSERVLNKLEQKIRILVYVSKCFFFFL